MTGGDDYDAIAPASDNCPTTFNVDQYDTDGDGTGDACDPSPTVASSGSFSAGQSHVLEARGVKFADLDGDGDLDVLYPAEANQNRVWLNDGAATFTNTQIFSSGANRAVALADLDGDGDIDAAFAKDNGQPNAVWLNDGTGTFTDSGQALGTASSFGVAVADVDGDGDLDMIFANRSGQPNTVWLNDGTATFTNSGQTLGTASSLGVAVGDLDGDGDIDATFAKDNGQPNAVWLNDGTGTFTDSGQALGTASSLGVAVGDLDGDGDIDATFATNGAGNTVWLNDGSGTFSNSGQALGSATSIGVALADFDNDGDLDAVYANNTNVSRVWRNDGTGTFTDSGQALGTETSQAVAVGDIDGDGDIDVMMANSAANGNKVWFNDGTMVFTGGASIGALTSRGVALGDLDGDGDLDAAFANWAGDPNTVRINTNTVATSMRLATGSYTGDAVDNRQITGAGFQPDLVIIKCACTQWTVARTSTMTGDATKLVDPAGSGLQANHVQTLDADGFTIGTTTNVNGSGNTYYWTAFKAGDELKLGSYVGDGNDNRSITGVGFQPVWVATFGDGDPSVHRPATVVGDRSYHMATASDAANRIQALEADGFQIGTEFVNQSGVTYHYVAWNASANVTQASYVGNWADNRSITGVGFQPEMVWVKRDTSKPGVWRPESIVGVLSFRWLDQVGLPDSIQALEVDGFQIGGDSNINFGGDTHHYIAFRDGGP